MTLMTLEQKQTKDLTVQCPRCGADVGEDCRGTGTTSRGVKCVHLARHHVWKPKGVEATVERFLP